MAQNNHKELQYDYKKTQREANIDKEMQYNYKETENNAKQTQRGTRWPEREREQNYEKEMQYHYKGRPNDYKDTQNDCRGHNHVVSFRLGVLILYRRGGGLLHVRVQGPVIS